MQKSTRLTMNYNPSKRKKSKAAIRWKSSYYIAMFGLLFLSGTTIGAVLSKSSGSNYLIKSLVSMTGAALELKLDQGFVTVFLNCLIPMMIMLLFIFLSGMCALAQPFILLAPIFRGLGFGACMGSLIHQYGSKGFLSGLVFVFPMAAAGAVILMYACREAWNYSFVCFRALTASSVNEKKELPLQSYILRFLFFTVATLGASLCCSLIHIAFSGLFQIK